MVTPLRLELLLLASWLLETMHGDELQPGPLNDTNTVLGSNPVPVIVKMNASPVRGEVGDVVIAVRTGPEPLDPDTVMGRLFDAGPEPF